MFKMEGKLLKIDLYFCTHQNENLLDELSKLCDEPDPEVGELWFSRQIEFLHFSRPIRIFDVLAALASPEGRPVGPRYEPFEIVGFSTRSE